MSDTVEHVDAEALSGLVYSIRGQRVLIDSDLAALYGLETRVLLQAVRRHLDRFPPDFMFQLSTEEALRSHFEISKGRGGRRYLPYAFTEQGVAMLSSVLNSPRAVPHPPAPSPVRGRGEAVRRPGAEVWGSPIPRPQWGATTGVPASAAGVGR